MKRGVKKLVWCIVVMLFVACGGPGAGQNQDSQTKQNQEGFAFGYDGQTIEVDKDVTPIIESLGEPLGYFESASCVFDEGLDKIFTYPSFEINTYPMDGTDYVSAVILKDDTVSTQEGICIGDSVGKVKEIYGEGETDTGLIIYKKGDMSLAFITHEDVVVSVEYRSDILNK